MQHSFHYYACYYALICFLHQQPQAASITIIIDGVTTNEWNTRDEYQRLVDQAGQSPYANLNADSYIDDDDSLVGNGPRTKTKINARESVAKKYCGTEFMDTIDVICESRYYSGQPQIAEPTIKTRRSRLGGPAKATAPLDDESDFTANGDQAGDGQATGNKRRFNRGFGRPLVRKSRQNAIQPPQSECCLRACTIDELKEIYCEKSKG